MNVKRYHITSEYLTVLAVFSILYAFSCAPSMLWQDSGMYQYRIWHNEIKGNLGLALSHPLYHIIGIVVKHIPAGEFAHRINLISSAAGAVAVANLFLFLRLYLKSILPALLASVTFAFSWTMWRSSSISEVYTLYMLFLSTEMIMLYKYIHTRRPYFLYLLALISGLALSVHLWAVIPLFCYLLFATVLLIQKRLSIKHAGLCLLMWFIGAIPYEYLIIKEFIGSSGLTAVFASALFGSSWQSRVLNTSLTARIVKENLLFIGYNFSTINFLFFFTGLYTLKSFKPMQGFRYILLGIMALFFIFAFRYKVPDRYAFFLPFYYFVCIFIGIGYHWLDRRWNNIFFRSIVLIFTLMPIFFYIYAPKLAEKKKIDLGTSRKIPYRNDYMWFLRPWKTSCKGPRRFALAALQRAAPDSLIYADGTTVYPLLYLQQVENVETGVTVVSEHGTLKDKNILKKQNIDEIYEKRGLYVVTPEKGYCPDFLLERFDFEPAGILWKAVLKKSSN